MADLYQPGIIPDTYDPVALFDELSRIAAALSELEVPRINLVPQGVEPTKYQEGDIVYANGTDWNPGSGAGLYERTSSAWNKL